MDAALDAVIGKVRQAAARARPLRIRGGGSKDFYGQRLHGELLDVRPLFDSSVGKPHTFPFSRYGPV